MTRKGEEERTEIFMAIDAKISFLNQTEKRLSSEVTADTMTQVLRIIADVLEGFSMRETVIDLEPNEDLLNCYLDALKVQGRSEKTIARYRYEIERMVKGIGVPIRRITVYHLRTYLSGQQGKGVSDTTTEGERQVFSAFFNWLQRENLIDRNPTANLGAIKCAKKQKKILTDVDLFNLKNNCENSRDSAIVMFLASTGCRISEVMNINRDDIDFFNTKCVVHGKGNKDRTAFFDAVTGVALRRYLMERTDDNPALFLNKYGKRMQPGGVRSMLKELAKRAGVEHVHPHKFRRTLATELARHGMPIQEVAFLLGHEKIDTTLKYVVQNDEDVKSNYRKYAV